MAPLPSRRQDVSAGRAGERGRLCGGGSKPRSSPAGGGFGRGCVEGRARPAAEARPGPAVPWAAPPEPLLGLGPERRPGLRRPGRPPSPWRVSERGPPCRDSACWVPGRCSVRNLAGSDVISEAVHLGLALKQRERVVVAPEQWYCAVQGWL